MHINRLYIDHFKNLLDLEITFETNKVPLALIGNNGSGKSNLIEALIRIFVGIYYNNSIEFSFEIEFVVNRRSVKIKKNQETDLLDIQIDGNPISKSLFHKRIREISGVAPFPELVFCYYSGSCDRIRKIIKKYNRSYNAILKKRTDKLERQFVFADMDQAEWVLLGLFAHGHSELLNRLNLGGFNDFKVTIQPPETFSEDKDDPLFWGTQGAIREFLADLDNASIEGYKPKGVGNSIQDKHRRTYKLSKSGLEKIGALLTSRKTNFLSMMQALAGRNILVDSEFKVINSRSNAQYPLDDLSEGEKQLLCVIGGLKLFNQQESLVLLDEPDTHLNPNWSWEYESLIKNALHQNQQDNSTVIIATHDPILISGMTKDQVLIANANEPALQFTNPVRDPRGQGVANVLTSEYFGLPSSLDKHTQDLLDERLRLSYKDERLMPQERERLKEINQQLHYLGLSISFRDPDYVEYEKNKYES